VVPDCLPALTSLQSLAVDGTNMQSEDEAAVAAGLTLALLQLVQLTRLELAVWSPGPLASPTALTSLRRLRRMRVQRCRTDAGCSSCKRSLRLSAW